MAPRKPPADLSEFDPYVQAQEQGLPVEILGPDNESPIGFSIILPGPESNRVQEARDQMQKDLLARESTDPLTPGEQYEQGTRFLARCCIKFLGAAKLDGKILQDTEDDFYKLFVRFRFIRQQVDVKIGRRDRFLAVLDKPSAKPSKDESTAS